MDGMIDEERMRGFGRNLALNFNVEDQLLQLVRVRLEPFEIEMPTTEQVKLLWDRLGLHQPLPDAVLMSRLEDKVWEVLPKLRRNLSGRNLRMARARSGSPKTRLDPEQLAWEERVREMSFDQLIRLAEANGLPVSTQTNPGLRMMQTRNLFYAKIRKEGRLVEIEDDRDAA